MRPNLASVSLLALSAAASTAAQPGAKGIDALLTTAVENKQLPMAVAMVANANGVIYERSVGTKADAIFAIASMTKPVTSVAAMQLVETGRVKLDEPASTYLKELAGIQVYDGGKMRAPKTAPTVRQLLTHTAGFGYEFLNADLIGLVARKQVPSMMLGDDGFLQAPLLFDPGARWEYGINTDWLGRLVERVSGQTLEAYFQQKIFQPLGMADSFFNVPDAKRSRMVPIFAKNADGSMAQQPTPPAKPAVFFSGGGGLFSTAGDYVRFMRALLQGGRLDGKRILSAESVATMGQNHIGALNVRAMTSQIPALASNSGAMVGSPDKFGLGFAVNSRPTAAGRSANTMSWAGIYNTFFWIDREKQIAAVFMTQLLPFLEPGVAKVVEDFDRAVYAVASAGDVPSSIRMADGRQWTTNNVNSKIDGSYCYDDAETNCDRYGRLYTWESAQRACRSLGAGWRLPTDDEWRQLAESYGGLLEQSADNGKATYAALVAGGKSGFNALLGGNRAPDAAKYERLEAHGLYWTASESGADTAWMYNFGRGGASVSRHRAGQKARAISVRCVKQEPM